MIHVAGTNGKTSVARIIEALLRAMGLRTGLMTSPALRDLTERMELDGEPISSGAFRGDLSADRAVPRDRGHRVRGRRWSADDHVRGGHGAWLRMFRRRPRLTWQWSRRAWGRWDATNVNEAEVAVITPIGMDHTDYLGDTLGKIAAEKAGIIKTGSTAVLAQQPPEVLAVLMQAADDASATVVLPEVDYELLARGLSVGGQVVTIRVADHVYEEVFCPCTAAIRPTTRRWRWLRSSRCWAACPSPRSWPRPWAVHSPAGSR